MAKQKHTPSNDNILPTLYKKVKIIKQVTMQETTLKMTQKLTKINYRDTGFLSNITTKERAQIIALSMYYQLGRIDPSNIFTVNYRNRDIINLVQQYA